MRWYFLLLLLLPPAAGAAQTAPVWPDPTRVLPDKLRRVPVGLTLTHAPNPVYPAPDSAHPGGYRWHHTTTVCSTVGALTVVECGSFIWYSAAGWQANLLYSPAEFAVLFACPAGQLRAGQAYTFPTNDRTTASARGLFGGDALWYILARDAQGRLYKGTGLIETEATVR